MPNDLFNLVAHGFQADPERFEGFRRYTFALVNEAEQNVLGPDVIVIE